MGDELQQPDAAMFFRWFAWKVGSRNKELQNVAKGHTSCGQENASNGSFIFADLIIV